MATSDLLLELWSQSLQLDEASERKVVVLMLLHLLQDANGEVQHLAVRWWVTYIYIYIHTISTMMKISRGAFESQPGPSGEQGEGGPGGGDGGGAVLQHG